MNFLEKTEISCLVQVIRCILLLYRCLPFRPLLLVIPNIEQSIQTGCFRGHLRHFHHFLRFEAHVSLGDIREAVATMQFIYAHRSLQKFDHYFPKRGILVILSKKNGFNLRKFQTQERVLASTVSQPGYSFRTPLTFGVIF